MVTEGQESVDSEVVWQQADSLVHQAKEGPWAAYRVVQVAVRISQHAEKLLCGL